jgi:hypothetical protein
MKILFLMPGPGYLRHYESTLRLLATRGHAIHLAFDHEDEEGTIGARAKENLERDHPSVSSGVTPRGGSTAWTGLASAVRLFMDYLRYFHPRYVDGSVLRERMQEKIPPEFLYAYEFLHTRFGIGVDRLMRILARIERLIPVDRRLKRWMSDKRPDVVLVTPLVYFGSSQVDYIKCAKTLGLKSALCVASWDNLTNKGLIRVVPDRVFVWNDIQKEEAVELHGVAPERVVATGAQTFDDWFDFKPTLTRDEFCRTAGLDPKKPYILYLCSSKFIAPHEAKFVERWLRQLRADADPRLREAGVMIRPHPKNFAQWNFSDASSLADVTVWPPNGEGAVESEAKAGFFNSLYYSATVVGINTSALIEAGIVGRSVHTILAPEFQRTQQGTLHFHYLLNAGDGLLRVAKDFQEHFQQLAEALSGSGSDERKGVRFVSTFVRPHGLDVPAAPRLADAIEAAGTAAAEPPWKQPMGAPLLRALLYPLASQCRNAWLRHKKGSVKRGGLLGMVLPDPESAWMRAIIKVFGRITLVMVIARIRRELKTRQAELDRKPSAWDRFVDGFKEVLTDTVSGLVDFSARGARFFLIRLAPVSRLLPGWAVRRVEDVAPWFSRLEMRIHHRSKLRSAGRIVAGPWLGDIWMELFLWVPFLNWVKTAYSLAPDRLLVVSRAGAASWYGPVTSNYMDVLDHFAPDELRREVDACRSSAGDCWQSKKSPVDQTVLNRLKRANKMELQDLFHPRVLFKMFRPLLENKSLQFLLSAYVRRFARFEGLYGADTALEPLDGLPKDYVAVKLYFNECFPDTPQNRRFLNDMLRDLTRRSDVVLLGLGFQLNGHSDFCPESIERVFGIDHLMTPATNLSVQTRVIRGAKAYVGPYGGFAYIAPVHGIKAYGLFSETNVLESSGQKLKQKICQEAGFRPVVLVNAKTQGPRISDVLDLPALPVLVGK